MRIAFGVAAVGAIVVTILAAGLVVSGRGGGGDHTQPHVTSSSASTAALDQPYQTNAGFHCFDPLLVRAFADGTSYPPGHPASPPVTRRPVRCYATAAQAAAAGYREAPLPPGALQLGGVYLAPVDQGLLGRCRRAASRLGFAVPCPGLLPSEQRGPPGATACAPPVDCVPLAGTFLLDDEQFIVPPSYVGVDGRPEGHLVVVGVANPADPSVGCYGARRIGAPSIHGIRAGLVTCQQGSETHGGHVLLRFAAGRTVVALRLHGWSKLNQQLVVQLVLHLRLVAPGRGAEAGTASGPNTASRPRLSAARLGDGMDLGR